MQNPNQLLEILWGEEINLAATGAVALSLAAGTVSYTHLTLPTILLV